MGGASHLQRMFPIQKVRAAFFTAGRIPAEEAYRLGAVEKLVSRDRLEEEARAFASVIAGKSRRTLVLAKEALNGLEPRDVDHGYRFEQGFTFEINLSGRADEHRDAFVAKPGDGKQSGETSGKGA